MQMLEPINGRELYSVSSAWVVTWTYFAYIDAPEDFVCIYDAKTRPDYVLRRVEHYYVSTRLSPLRQLQYADDRDSLSIHEQAHFVLGTYKSEIWCGLHPTLYARKVENIRIVCDSMGKEHLVWDDPDHSAAREEIMAQLSQTSTNTKQETE